MTAHATLTVDPVDPHDEAALREWFDLDVAAHALDHPDDPPPCRVAHRAQLDAPWPGEPTRAWLARCGGRLAGVAVLSLPEYDNTGSALGEIRVGPAHRHTGVGRALLALLVDESRAAGRVRLLGEVHSPLTSGSPGTAFATAVGAHDALVDVRRRLRLPGDGETDRARLAATAASASPDYELVQWTDAVPDAHVEDLARLTGRMSTDAPLGDLTWEPEAYDADRIREREAMCAAHGRTILASAARAPDGHLVAFTELGVEASVNWHAHTWNTLVQPEHRGHRLGLRVKLANLALLRDRHPAMRQVDTYNAASNAHMIAINEAVGFRPHDRLHEYQLEL